MAPKKKPKFTCLEYDPSRVNRLAALHKSRIDGTQGTTSQESSPASLDTGIRLTASTSYNPSASSGSSSAGATVPCILQAPRRDAPTIDFSRRASKELALAAASSDGSRALALEALSQDVAANSARGVNDTLLKTWMEFHTSWFGPGVSLLPLDTNKLQCVGAMFKQGKYRSFKNYLSAVKDAHIKEMYVWDQSLDRMARRITRSVLRGIGPPRQAGTLNLKKIAELPAITDPISNGGPLGPTNLVMAGSFWLTREIELSLALAKNITVHKDNETVDWLLPATKTDPSALGKSRTWGCVCRGKWTTPCGYHAIVNQLDLLSERFGKEGIIPDCIPLFPTSNGTTVAKEKVVKTIEHFANLLGENLLGPDGARIFSGHSMRVMGSQHLAGIGIPLAMLQLLARHQSDIILRYVQEAPLLNLTNEYRNLMDKNELGNFAHGLRSEVVDLVKVRNFANLNDYNALKQQMEELDKKLKSVDCKVNCHIVNMDSGKSHRPLLDEPLFGPSEMTTACGWKFGLSRYERTIGFPSNYKFICGKCWPTEKAAFRANAEDSSDSDSSLDSE